MVRLILFRALLFAAPFVVWWIWAAWARRNGREMGATPWPWLFAAGCLVVVLSLLATALFSRDNLGKTYVPGEVTPSGRVTEGRFEPK